MADAFALLRTGTSFDKTAPKETKVTGDSAKHNTALPPELDFFGDVPRQPEPPKSTILAPDRNSKKRKRQQVASSPVPPDSSSVEQLRKRYRINVTGTDPPPPLSSFQDLAPYNVPEYLESNISRLDFNAPTPVQMQSIPIILSKRDLLACAPTGSGKTLAYLIPLLMVLDTHRSKGFRVLIITPTRELAQQIDNEIKKLAQGRNFKVCLLTKRILEQFKSDVSKCQKYDILISTPMRLVHGITDNCIELGSVKHLVLDEADKLFELGLLEQTDEILAACTAENVQKSLFSATIPAAVEQLARSVMTDPLRVIIGLKDSATDTVTQELVYAGTENGKLFALRQLITSGTFSPPCLVFVQSIDRAKALYTELSTLPYKVDVMHSEMPKKQRDLVITKFRDGETWILICTDVLSRGIDVLGIKLVVNYDFPMGTMSYIHRIGRTGRAGRTGKAITFFTNDDKEHLNIVVNVMKQSGCNIPAWMDQLPKLTKRDKRRIKQKMVKRKDIDAESKLERRIKRGKSKKTA